MKSCRIRNTTASRQYFADIRKVIAVDARTVRYEFARQNQELPLICGEMPILPQHVYGAPGKNFGKDFDTLAVGSVSTHH